MKSRVSFYNSNMGSRCEDLESFSFASVSDVATKFPDISANMTITIAVIGEVIWNSET